MKLFTSPQSLNRISFIAVLMSLAFTSNLSLAKDSDIRSKVHPLFGFWESKDSNTGCKETYAFNEGGKGVFTSDKEVVDVVYEVENQPNERGFFKLTHTVKQSNGEKDCTKETSSVNEPKVSYLLFQPDGYAFVACDNDDALLETCFGPMQLKAMSQPTPMKLN